MMVCVREETREAEPAVTEGGRRRHTETGGKERREGGGRDRQTDGERKSESGGGLINLLCYVFC
jgi:hypothetical protein